MNPKPPQTYRGSSFGKLILFGEYAVLEGDFALVVGSSKTATARYRQYSRDDQLSAQLGDLSAQRRSLCQYTVEGVDLGIGTLVQPSSQDPLKDPISRFHQREVIGVDFPLAWMTLLVLDAPIGHYTINTRSFGVVHEGVWHKVGLGSSGASTVALVDLISQLQGERRSAEDRYQITQMIHHYVQGGLGSGADVAASAYGGLIRYRWWERTGGDQELLGSAQIIPLSYSLPWPLLCIWSGTSASTPDLVRTVRQWALKNPGLYQRALERISYAEAFAFEVLSSSSNDSLSSDDSSGSDDSSASWLKWCEAVSLGGEAAYALGQESGAPIWGEVHQQLQELLRPFGAQIKPTGAGGGDLVLVAIPEPELLSRVKSHLKANHWNTITVMSGGASVRGAQ